MKDYTFSDSGELELVIPYAIPSLQGYIPNEYKDRCKIHFSLKPEEDTLVGNSIQDNQKLPVTFKKVSDAPTAYYEKDTLTINEMQEDLAVIFDILENNHPNAFYTQERDIYDKKKAELLAKLDKLDKTNFYYEVKRFVASIGDSHTGISAPTDIRKTFEILPISIDYFSDKWNITSAYPEYKQLLGKELTAINDIPIAKLMERILEMIAYENEALRIHNFKNAFNSIGFLKFLGIANSNKVLVTCNGSEKVEVKAIPNEDFISDNAVKLGKDAPTAFQEDKHYFCQKLDDDIFYIQYNQCVETTPTLTEFGAEIEKQLSEHTYKKIIIDLRNNSGGNSTLINYFYPPIEKAKSGGAKIYALTGRQTFSAAFNNAIELQRKGVTLVGQPTGGNMQQFTEINSFDLPNSRIHGQFSTVYCNYDHLKPNDSLYPDVQIDHTLEAYINGIDEEIEYIKKLPVTD